MTQPPSPHEPRREYPLPEEPSVSKIGKMEGIKSAKHAEGPRLSEKVPTLSPYEGGSFKHKVIYIKNVEGWKAVFQFILSKIFSFIKPQKKSEMGRTSSDVRADFKTKLNIDVDALQRNWGEVQKGGTRQEAIDFHKDIQYKLISIEESAFFIPDEKEGVSASLRSLRDQSDEHLQQVFVQKSVGIQKYPIEEDPLLFLNFYSHLSETAFDTGSKRLNTVKAQAQAMLTDRLNERVKSLGLPDRALDEAARQAEVSLDREAPFGQKVALVREKLQAQFKSAQDPINEIHKIISSLQSQRKELSRQLERDDELKSVIETREASEIKVFEMRSKDLNREIDSLNKEIAALASETKKKQVRLKEQKITERDVKIGEQEKLGLEYSKRIKGITADVERALQIEQLNERARADLSGRIRILDERIEATRSQLTEQETQLGPLEIQFSSLESIERMVDHLTSSEISTVVRLVAFEEMFREFQTQNERPKQFFSNLAQNEKFKSIVFQKVHDLLGKTRHIEDEVKKALNLLVSRNVNPRLAKELGVEEFLAT